MGDPLVGERVKSLKGEASKYAPDFSIEIHFANQMTS